MEKNKKMKFLFVVGARPNFIKIAPLFEEFKKYPEIKPILVHTGQHYDYRMSQIFFQELKIPRPNYNLKVGSGSHAWQTAKVMEKLEPVVLKEKPDLVIVVGDVNSTLAGALTAVKLHIPVAHIEAGLRSYDKTMPEEVNRILVDRISDFLFVTEKSGLKNLKMEGMSAKNIYFVGNTMIDNLIYFLPKIDKSSILKELTVQPKKFIVVTLHRPSNIDSREKIVKILEIFKLISKNLFIIFPIHPRTKKNIKKFGLMANFEKIRNLKLIQPLGYFDFLKLAKNSRFVLTDSGGIQEEAAYLKIPTLTLRNNTERPSTIDCGANKLIKFNGKEISAGVKWALSINPQKIRKIPYYDGKVADRIIKILSHKLQPH